jgi:imidazolonepropionase-like amidohydrolase
MRSNASFLIAFACAACAAARPLPEPPRKDEKTLELDLKTPWVDPEAHRTEPRPWRPPARKVATPVVIRHATILGAGGRIEDGTLVLKDGLIQAVGKSVPVPAGAVEIDATGRFVTPGIIDSHSHLGVYPSPSVGANDDGNELSAPNTAGAAAEFAYWPQDPGITRALAGGVVAALVLPGSANLVGGRGVIVEMRPGRTIDEVKLAGAPDTVKMACGENPKRVYGDKGGPVTRMAMYDDFRSLFAEALEYKVALDLWSVKRADWERRRRRAEELEKAARKQGKQGKFVKAEDPPERPKYVGKLETLSRVLRGEALVQIHCYRASDLRQMVKIADEFGFRIRSFHHALEAYKVRDLLIEHGIAINTWADWWGFKMEAFDGIPENAALFHESGGRVVIHSDSAIEIQHLNQEAAKAMQAGVAAGIPISEEDALRWITLNAAWVLGIDDKTGSLEAGKRADVVVWDRHPFSVYARADQVFIAGDKAYDRQAGGLVPTDFELGNSALEGAP